jgi:asparagine synthase (glutamine-hydrolysing)
MAGIAGVYGPTQNREMVVQMLAALQHRGPDTEEIHQIGALDAGVRSSVLSEARGDGFACDSNIAVFLDGDIYNARDNGQSDANVVLNLYKQHGRTFPGYLEGVFACAVYDGQDLILARDSVGVRPLYWGTTDNGDLCFASELKALVGVAQDVSELHPSTTYSARHGISGYLPRFPEVRIPSDAQDAAKALRRCVTEAVARRLEDGAVGACLLSGGLDSSIIAAAAMEIGANLPAVTVGMEGAPDLENAKIMAEHLGMEHHVRLYAAKDIAEAVPRAVRALESFEEDCVSGVISNLFASAKAAEFTNCILSGEGGDELFGGYHLLKDLPTQTERLKMMKRLIEVAYNTAVQRLDRGMMGNSINYRTPFIDTEVVAFASQIPVDWKIHKSGSGDLVEKWILREAFKDLLPEKIYKRPKLRFSVGTGTDSVMDNIARAPIRESQFTEESRKTLSGYHLNSPKELWYYRIFKDKFPAPCFEKLVGRWDPAK